MISIPQDLRLGEFWKYLPYQDIINLCIISSELNQICKSNSVWKYLLFRNFGINNVLQNSHKFYLLYKKVIEYINSYIPIITQQALVALVKIWKWPNLKECIKLRLEYDINLDYPTKIFTIMTIEEALVNWNR